MDIDDFAPNLSFFFSNGMDPEYAVIGRVARRIWAKAIKHRYGGERAQPEAQVPHPDQRPQPPRAGDRLQRHPHDAAGALRDLRQLQLAAHQRLRRGHHDADRGERAPRHGHPAHHQQGARPRRRTRTRCRAAFIIEELTDLVERPCCAEFRRSQERGGVLGAMERMYQRTRSRKSRCYYETLKHDGELPIIGVNTFLDPKGSPTIIPKEVIRSTPEEKDARNVERTGPALEALTQAALKGKNVFDALMDVCKVCTLGQISGALYEVGGQYRRNM
jgi:methylmalonyl-CoA mutase